jgi:hypothetical protein
MNHRLSTTGHLLELISNEVKNFGVQCSKFDVRYSSQAPLRKALREHSPLNFSSYDVSSLTPVKSALPFFRNS